MSSGRPIGIFDSGIGGLTVAQAIRDLLPHEDIVYFGDTAHMPYGDKADDSIKYYSLKITHFLLKQGVKTIVIACNTASAIAYQVVKDFVEDKAIVVNVIDPMVEYLDNTFKEKAKVGVIGTKATVRSGAYEKRIKKIGRFEVQSLATPLLAPMIEEGFFNNNISRSVIHSYLSHRRLKKINILILACTHYPLIKREIEKFYSGEVHVIDSATIVANSIKTLLQRKKLLNPKSAKGKNTFYISEYTAPFHESARIFFKGKFSLTEKNIWL